MSDAVIAEAVAMRRAGEELKTIAASFRVSVRTVSRWMKEAGVRALTGRERELAIAQGLIDDAMHLHRKMSIEQIASQLDTPPRIVRAAVYLGQRCAMAGGEP